MRLEESMLNPLCKELPLIVLEELAVHILYAMIHSTSKRLNEERCEFVRELLISILSLRGEWTRLSYWRRVYDDLYAITYSDKDYRRLSRIVTPSLRKHHYGRIDVFDRTSPVYKRFKHYMKKYVYNEKGIIYGKTNKRRKEKGNKKTT